MELLQADLTEDCDQRSDDSDTKKIDCVYFVKFRSIEAENLKSRIESTEKLMQKGEQTRQYVEQKLQEIKALSIEMEELNKKAQELNVKFLDDESSTADNISCILGDLEVVNQMKAEQYTRILGLRKQMDDLLFKDKCFNENLKVLDSAKELALDRDVEGLMELSKRQVEKFMSQWSESKAFRDDYEKRSLPFRRCRQLSKDGREVEDDTRWPILKLMELVDEVRGWDEK